MEIIYELFFKSLWQIFMYVKQELQCDNKIISSRDRMSINKSTSKNYPLICNKRKYPELSREKYHMNMNRVASTSSTIDTHIVLIPVRSVHCQTEMWKNDLQTINIDLNQSETNVQQLTDTFCRRLDEPLIFMNRELYGRYNRSSFSSGINEMQYPQEKQACISLGFPHSGQNFSQQKSELSTHKQSPINEGANENRSILYSGKPLDSILGLCLFVF